MDDIIFNQKDKEPQEDELKLAMGKTYQLRSEFISFIEENFNSIVLEWKYYGQKSGWIQKNLLKKRNLFFFIPYKNNFKVGFVFGDKAVAVIEKSSVSKEIIDELKNARKYAEGRGLRLAINNRINLEEAKKLVTIKIEN